MLLPTFAYPRDKAAELLSDSATLATTLHTILLAAYGEEIYDLEVLELYARIQDDFGVQLTEEGENRWQAIAMAVSTDAFYEDMDSFLAICNALYSGDVLDPSAMLDEVTMPEVLWAVWEVELNREEAEPFALDIEQFMSEILDDENEDPDEEDIDSGPYYARFIEAMKVELHTQLLHLGADAREVAAALA